MHHTVMFTPVRFRRRWPEGGPGVLGPWTAAAPRRPRRARAGAAIAAHCLPTLF
jgi:hypothetical protein